MTGLNSDYSKFDIFYLSVHTSMCVLYAYEDIEAIWFNLKNVFFYEWNTWYIAFVNKVLPVFLSKKKFVLLLSMENKIHNKTSLPFRAWETVPHFRITFDFKVYA